MGRARQTVTVTTTRRTRRQTSPKATASTQPKTSNSGGNQNRCPVCGKYMGNHK